MSDDYSEQSRAASSGRAGADRMAAGLGICVDEDRGDLDEVLRLRAEIARLREERRWIPVGERLPEHCDIVWVYDGTDVVIGEYWGTWESYGASCDREGLNSKTLAGITHWAEIVPPQPPPKGGEVE